MKILIAYDGSGDARTALDDLPRAGLPARAEAVIVSVAEEYLRPEETPPAQQDGEIAFYFQERRAQIERNLSEARRLAFEAREKLQKHFPGWTVKTAVSAGPAAREILSKAAAFQPGLLVAGARGLSRFAETRLGGISQAVLCEARCAVRVGRGKFDADSRRLKIAVCFDGSAGAHKALDAVAARSWISAPEVGLFVVADLMDPLVPGGRAFQAWPGFREEGLAGERGWVETIAGGALKTLRAAGLSAALHVFSGNPRLVLPEKTSEWDADLIVAGARSAAELSGTGSIALAIAARAFCTVEIVR